MCVFQAADEPAYLTVGTDVSAKYRGAFCEAKIKTVKRLVKVKVRPVCPLSQRWRDVWCQAVKSVSVSSGHSER